MQSDILAGVDRGDLATLVLLDVSAAFDTVDHGILLERLWRWFGIIDNEHSWLSSYRCDERVVVAVPLQIKVGPIMFVLYTTELQAVIERYGRYASLRYDTGLPVAADVTYPDAS